jgi:hypothetical protein
MRRFLFLAIAVVGLTAAMLPPKPKTPAGALMLRTDAAFTKLWAIWTVSTGGGTDSLVVLVKVTGKADVRRRYVVTTKTDSLDAGYPAPGTSTTVTLLAVAYKLGKSSDTVTIGSGTVQGDVPTPTGTLKLIPAAWTQVADSGAVCKTWQANHPGQTPWIVVNTTAVAACQAPNGPKVFQACLVYLPEDGSTPQLCVPNGTVCQIGATGWTADAAQYCQGQYAAFLAARS